MAIFTQFILNFWNKHRKQWRAPKPFQENKLHAFIVIVFRLFEDDNIFLVTSLQNILRQTNSNHTIAVPGVYISNNKNHLTLAVSLSLSLVGPIHTTVISREVCPPDLMRVVKLDPRAPKSMSVKAVPVLSVTISCVPLANEPVKSNPNSSQTYLQTQALEYPHCSLFSPNNKTTYTQ